ncbi:DUF3857 domain-containing protein [Hyunsoonleella pacifica]|uniref:DUF3857 domain-containing protein n=1 Tax=Hyunsoonleella pacifica TaxID=1080224 RepID=A0A4V2JB28_9FLAO|nr:DUF3857 domain-containing protein [Hyunsoonleella pacifica]TBN16563.1 DUF3857 domain-containing protein [Hyunsoonleella pacifica]GGD18393.1 hypothetical protein GCM10011368_20360 [Hyunsoonleella pacifica]
MIKSKLLFVILFVVQIIPAQTTLFFSDYDWEKTPSYAVPEGTDDPIIGIKDKIATEFYFEDDGLVEYFLEHKVYWLNSDEKIEAYNKVYLPYNNSSELKINKARVITKDHKIIELDESKILTAQDEETGRNYKYFAFEGVTKGSFIEYFYVVKRYPRYSGNRITFQKSYHIKDLEFDVYAPKNLFFEFKSYNNIPEIERDTVMEDKLHWQLKINNLGGLLKEEVSAYNALKGSIIYKLDRNTYNNVRDISSYSKVAQNIYNFYYPEISDKTTKQLKKFIEEATDKKSLEGEALIRKLEFYVKSNIFISEGGSENLKDLNEVIKNKVANESGILKLYTALFKHLGIKHEIVLTSDRQELKFDKEFEANNFLTDFLIYFNTYKTYISPIELDSRYGFPPANFTDNYGLFVKEVKVGDFTSGLGKIKYIKPIPAEKTVDKMILDITFETDNIANCNVNLDRAMSGYYGMYFHPIMNLIKEENKDELVESFATRLHKDVTINSKEIINEDPELFGVKPLHFVLDFESEAFTEKAGKKYLFKVGELIGRQIEMYQEKQRVLPVENDFTRSYFRTINITIPEGYKVANLDDINIKNTHMENGKEILIFDSYYEIDSNQLKITADEHYRKNTIEVEHFEAYRAVINSAADFNKVVLVFEPI